MNEYKFYIQQINKDNSIGLQKDLEKDFVGLKYIKLEGIDNYGKPRIYTENYADSNDLRVYIPSNMTRDNPELTLTVAFVGENRRNTYHEFINFISGRKLIYYDTCRNRKVNMVLLNEVSINEDKLIGSTPYIEVSIRFKNLSDKSIQK